MTPEERADNIFLRLLPSYRKRQVVDRKAEVDVIASEIRAAVEERKGNPFAANPHEWFCLDCRPLIESAVKQAVEEAENKAAAGMQTTMTKLAHEWVAKARAEAYEDAAKIADDEECVCTDDVNCNGNYRIAEKLRARAAEVGK